ncbi:MAG: hypothetical protein IH991_23745 [Planctomycetes bacterium]|nr:hypothetical protein [Planctomycetota bacterium]
MSEEPGLAQSSSRDCCSWSLISRSFRISIAFPILLLASLGAVLTPLGWWLSAEIFVSDKMLADADDDFRASVARNKRLPSEMKANDNQPKPEPKGETPIESITTAVVTNVNSIPGLIYYRFVEPFRELFNIEKGLSRFVYFLFGGLWTVLVWALFGGAITRIAIMQLGCDERISMRDGLKHAMRKISSYFMSPLLPIIGVVFCAVPIVILGLIMKADFGVIIGSVFWVLALLSGFVMALLLLGLLFGWPLMWATLSAEGTDSFDALSRSYAYTFQRPLKYLFYVVMAALLGALTFWLVFYFSETLIHLTYWGAHWGTGSERMGEIKNAVDGKADGVLHFGASIINILEHIIRTLAAAFSYSFFWCAMCAIYLLLRRDVDQTEFDEIFVDDEEERFGLPQVKPDAAGVPSVVDKPAEEKPEDKSQSESTEAAEEPSEEESESSESEDSDDSEEKEKDSSSDEG